ncbi:hypothetical protein EGW08_008798, partial [Elysia chlorotica]
SYGSGLHSPPHIGRPVDRVFEEAQFTGEIFLNGRKLRDYPKICSKYDLSDTTHVDVSRNRLIDIPSEFCDYVNAERINCYHNVIRSIPDAISQLQSLTHINLSRNQLTVLTPALCMLGALEVLSASNNKLVSLPEEIGRLENLMDLDVSCNEISHLPLQIGDLSSLRCLNLRRNFLVELPIEISRLQLCRLDFSSNRIEKIPTVFRKMESLEQFILDHNPLSSPPAYICTKGRQHIMKFLHIEAIKEDRKRGIMINSDSDMKRFVRKSLPPQQSSDEMRNMLGAPESKWKRHTVLSNDSGYNSTGDLPDRNGWHSGETQTIPENNDTNNSRLSNPYQRNPPIHQNSRQHLTGNPYQQEPQQSYPSNHAGPGSSVRRSPEDGFASQVPRRLTPQHDYDGGYPGRTQQLSPNTHSHHHQQQQQHSSSYAYKQHQHQQDSPQQQYQHHHLQESSSQYGRRPPMGPVGPLSHQQDQHPTSPGQSPEAVTSVHTHQRSGAMPSYIPRHMERAPSPSYSTHSVHSNHSSDALPPPPAINRSRSPSGFYQPVSTSAAPIHSRQGSNSSLASNLSSTSRSMHAPYQTQQHPPPHPSMLNSLPPPAANLTPGGNTDRYSPSVPQSNHYSPAGGSSHNFRYADDGDPPPPPLPPPYSDEAAFPPSSPLSPGRLGGRASPPLTPPTPPMVITGDFEDEFTRELKRQKAEYDRKKRQAEQIRVQQEEEEEREKEERRKAALKLQEEQRVLLERQEEQRRQEERLRRQQEEEREMAQEEQRKRREEEEAAAARKREEELQRLQEAVRSQAEEDKTNVIMRNTAKQPESKGPLEKNKLSNKNSISTQSLKEQQRLAGGSTSNGSARAPQQYRRAASDSLRKPGLVSPLGSQVDSLNYINRNGVAPDGRPRSRQSSTSTTPSVSPGPSPRNSISHLAKPTSVSSSASQGAGSGSANSTRSPMGSQSHLAKPKSSVPRAAGNSGTASTNGPSSVAAPAQSQAVRRAKASADRSNASSPVTVRSPRVAGPGGIARAQGGANTSTGSNLRQGNSNGSLDDESKLKKAASTPTEPTTRLKSRLAEPKYTGINSSGPRLKQIDSTDNKRINTRPPTSTYGSGRGKVGNAAGRAGEESTYTIRRREEQQREEAEQMDRLRQTVESRLRVTLPDNLADALRDGVVLCHLANQIRPRSVGSIHVPSPAVPKLTLAKCRRNVDNFLDACRKIGVDQEQICGPQDIFDEKGISRVALTVAALVAIGTNPKQSAV